MILDASVVLASFEKSGVTRKLRGEAALAAPDLIVPESLNAVWKIVRVGGAAPTVAQMLAVLDYVRIVPSRPYIGRASDLATALDHSVYDCLYLAMAEAESDVLATLDARFARKVKGALRKRILLL